MNGLAAAFVTFLLAGVVVIQRLDCRAIYHVTLSITRQISSASVVAYK